MTASALDSRGETLGAGLAGALRASRAGETVPGPVALGVGGSWGTTRPLMKGLSPCSGMGVTEPVDDGAVEMCWGDGGDGGGVVAEVEAPLSTRVAINEATLSPFRGAVLATRGRCCSGEVGAGSGLASAGDDAPLTSVSDLHRKPMSA